MRDDKRPLAELLWYAGGLLPLAVVCLFWASMGDQPVLPQRIVLLVVGAVIGGCGLLAIGELIRPTITAQAQTPNSGSMAVPNTMGPINNNQGIITQGQTGNNTIIQAPLPRQLGQDAKAKLLELPKSRKILVFYQTTESDAASLAAQIVGFLNASGYSVNDPTGGMFLPVPHGIVVNLNADHPERPILISIGLS